MSEEVDKYYDKAVKNAANSGVGYVSLSQIVKDYLDKVNNVQDAEFEIIDNRNCVFDVKQIENRLIELGELEDIEHEIIQPKQLTNKTESHE